MRKHLLAAVILLTTSATHARISFSTGSQLDYILASTGYQIFANDATYAMHYRNGVAGGLTAELSLSYLLVRPALLYAQKGYTNRKSATEQA